MTTELKVKVRVFAMVREIVGNKHHYLNVNKGSSIEQVIQKFVEIFPDTKDYLFDNEVISSNFVIALNGRSITHQDLTSTLVEDNDEIALVPPAGGG